MDRIERAQHLPDEVHSLAGLLVQTLPRERCGQ
jgi:hypothetical protein